MSPEKALFLKLWSLVTDEVTVRWLGYQDLDQGSYSQKHSQFFSMPGIGRQCGAVPRWRKGSAGHIFGGRLVQACLCIPQSLLPCVLWHSEVSGLTHHTPAAVMSGLEGYSSGAS